MFPVFLVPPSMLTLKTPFTTLLVFVARTDQDQAAQNVQTDL